MKNNMKWMKRVMAMVLTLCMMLGSMSGYVPGWFAAFAEEEAAGTAETPAEATVTEGTGKSEGEQPAEQPVAPTEEKAAEEKQEAPKQEEKPAEEAKPVEEKLVEDKKEEAPVEKEAPVVVEETPAEVKKPAEEAKPAEQPKQDEQPAGDEPAEQPKQEEQPAEDEPAEQPEQDEQPAGDEPTEQPKQDEQPAGDEPAEQPEQEEQPAEDEPAEQPKQDEQPAEDEPAEQPKQDEQPAEDEPAEPPKQEEKPVEKQEEAPAKEEVPKEEKPAEKQEEAPVQEEAPKEEKPVEKQEEAPAQEEAPKQEEKPVEKQEEAPVQEEAPKQEEKPVEKQEEAPAQEEAPKEEKPVEKQEEAPAKEEAPKQEEKPVEKQEEAPVQEEAPKQEEKPVEKQEEAPAQEEAPKQEEKPVEKQEEAPAKEEAPKQEEKPAEKQEEAPVQEEAPKEEKPIEKQEEAPAKEEAPVEENTPVEETTPVEEAALVEEATPVEETAPVEKKATVEEATPVEEVAPVEEGTPAEVETPAEEETSAEEEVPVEEETPAEEEAPVEEEAPAEEEIPAGTEASAIVEPVPTNDVASIINTTPAGAPAVIETAAPAEEETDSTVGLLVAPEGSQDEPDEDKEGESRELKTQVGDYLITATGNIPENAEIQVAEIPVETAATMTNKKLLFAYDIRLVVDGQVWQPEEHGASVQISVKNLNGDLGEKDIDIVHIKTDLMDEDGNLSEEALEKALQGLDDGAVEKERIDTDADDASVSFGTGSFSGFLGTAMAKLQAMFKEAMQSRTAGQTKVQLTLDKDTTYEGDVNFSTDEYQAEEGFEVELVSEDAGDDYLQADGTTKIAGNIIVKGINLLVKGISIATGNKVTVENAKLNYYGTKADDAVTVELKGAKSEANISTGEGNDTVDATAEGGKLNIQTGEGGDIVTAILSGTASADIATEAGEDKVNVNDTATGKVTVSTGDDNDTVEVDVGAAGGYSVGEVTVNTGDGDDSVTLTNKNGSTPTVSENRKGNITVDLGTGVNEATVSTDVAGVAPKVTIHGENGNDHVHITGTLNSGTDAKERITGTKDSLAIASDKGAMTLALGQIESLTDDLKNKRTETLTVEDGKKVDFTYNGAEAFTNYLLKAPASNIQKIVVKGKDGAPLLLSSLVIDTATTWNGENKLIIPEGAMIDAQGMTVRLTARDIQVDGTIKADTVQIEALDGTGMYSRNYSDVYEAYKGTIPVWGVDQAGSTLAAGAEMAWDLVNINDEATITIGEKGAVMASGDVILLARVEQSGTLISLIPLNVVNVKVAHASVDIAGKVYAGVTNIGQVNKSLSNVQYDDTRGSVRVNAEIKTTIGYDDKGHMSDGWPVAVSVVYANAEVNVGKNAEIKAAKDVQIGSKSEIKAATRADSGLAGLPAAVAVAVLINDVRTTVDGTLDAKNGDVKVTANGDVNARTIADKGDGQTSLSGGYAAVTVAVQDVKAELGKTAVVNAKGQAQVLSNAVEKVENHATSGKQDSEEVKDDSLMGKAKSLVIDTLVSKVWPKVKEYLGKKFFPESAEEKLDKAINKVSTGDHSVKLAENAQAHGDVYATVDTMDGKTRVNVNVMPREGYKVKRVLWRGYNAGDSKYTLGEAIGIGNDWSFIQNIQNVTVFVIYAEDNTSDTSSATEDDVDVDEFFKQYQQTDDDGEVSEGEVEKIIEDMNAELEEDQELDRQLEELEEGTEFVKLKWQSSNGSVLTYETKNDDYINRLDEVYTGQKVRLIPNPKDGYKLKNGGLTATYSVTETVDGKETVVVKKVVINPDDQGRYYLEVPEKDKIEIQQGITINAVFEKGESSKDADNTQLQLTGTLAVAVTDNDNQALVDEGAQVTAGSTEVAAIANTDVQNIADGTAVSKETAAEKKSSDEYAIKRPDSKEYSGYTVEGMKYGLLADATQNGSIQVEKANGASAYQFTVEATPKDGYKVGTALLTYYKDGKKKTAELKPDGDGKYSFSLTGSGTNALDADAGSTAVLSFGFVGEADVTVAEATTSEPQTIISNPIQISYNALKEEKYTDGTAATSKGTILYNANKNKTADGNITAYAFKATPNTEKGFALDGKLKATWKDASGQTQSRELTEENGVWYLQLDGITAGAPVKVSGAFKDDLHSFKVDTGKTENGTVTLHDAQVKTTDKPKITVTPSAGFSVGDIVVTYKDGLTRAEKTLKLSKGDLVQVQKDGKPVEGLYELKQNLPGLSAGDVTVYASFNRKSIGIYAGENDKDTDYTLSEKNAAKGDKVTVTPNDDKVKNGYKVTKVTVTDASGNTVAETSDGVFTVPENTDNSAKLTVKVQLGLKDIEIRNAELDHGKVVSTVARADRGEKVTVNIVPDANFRLKSGTLKAVVTDKDGNTSEVFASRQNDTTYTFDMPSDIAKDSRVSFIGDFEPGQSDSSAVETSLGAGIAVTVSNSETRADVKGKITSQGNVKTQAEITGGVKTEAAAGYSKGNIGMGGAVSVQVASMDAKALIHKTADITLDGRLIVDSAADIKYTVNADASGSKQAASTGVGAGIAVAVNGSDTFAAVQDGAKLNGNVKGVSVTALQKLEDTVSAKAGAAGGTAVVPVAAVDVTAAQAKAYMGKVSADNLKLTENVGISARTDASHTISADASASGAGLGAAISVSVLSDKAWAKLNQSLEAGQVAVAAETISKVINNATASAAGGRTSGKSADSQADGLLGGASRLAGKNKSSGVTPNAITNATKDRQKAETSEGSVDVAGAAVVNVQDSVSRAEIADGVNVKADGLLAVIATNGTTSKVKANANTTNSNVGVGVGVAVNIVGLENIARMGNGDFEAAMLKAAATTKETEPEEKKTVPAAELAQDKDAAANELAEMVSGYMADLAKEIGLDQYVPEELLSDILNPIITEVTDELLKVSGLGELFAGDGLQAKYDSAIKLLQGKGSALASLPDQLIAPLMDIVKDAMDLGDLSEEDYKKLSQALADEFTQAFKDNLMDYKTLGMSALDTLKGGALQWAKKEAPGILKGMFKGNQKWTNWKRMGAGLRKYLGGALVEELKRVSVKSFEQALGNVNLPGVSMLNQSRAVKAFNEVKDVFKAGELTAIFEDAAEYATETFKTQVFDYDKMLTALSGVDWVDKISTALRTGAQKAMVNLTNEAVSTLTSTLGVQLEAQQEQATGHVIDTQAISGAGARSVGIAGSVAITVLNAQTEATVADGKTLAVTGDMTVEANELRSVKNVASAALDSKGNAKDNKSSEDANGKDIGGNEAKSVVQNDKKNTVLTVNVGGTATIREGDKGENRPVVYITLKDGYKMPDGNKLNYTYTNKDGVEVHGTVVAKQDGESWVVDTANNSELKKAAADAVIELELQPVEVLTELPKPSVLSDASVPEDAVSLAVKGREEKDGKLSARAGETVEVKVKRVAGMKLTGLGYAYTDENGVKHEVTINPGDGNSAKEKGFAMVSSNKDEYVYSIVMPKGTVTEILAQMEAGEEEDTGVSQTHATDASGAGVGVGASFSMVYGDSSTHAEVGKRSGTVTAGSMNVAAASEHMENISSAAGTDPLTGELNTANTKTVGVDASVALNILDNDIKAFVDKASTVNVKTGDLNVTATEESRTETTSSAFSVGDMTAVGASVAINLADTAVSASLEGGATVAGSAKVASDSYSEDVTKALATAMGADIARSLAKVGQTVSNDLEEKANKLLSGEYMKSSGKQDNKTAQNINSRLDKKAAGSDKTVNGQTTSSNALRALDAKTANGGEGMGDVNTGVGEVNNATGANLDGAKEQESVKVMVAAAVGITAASHEAGTRVGKIVAGKSIDLTSENTGNFNTLGTGAAMSLAKNSNAIAFGVAISTSSNTAGVTATGDIISQNNEDVNVTSTLTQNMDGDFAGKLAAQSLAGSVAGKSGKVSLAGAVSVVTAGGSSTVSIAGGTNANNRTIQGGNVTVEATDKSKLAARAGGLSLSTGASVGMGVGSTTVVSGNTVTAAIGDYAKITADSFKLNAEKQEVTLDDYKNLVDMRYLITDSSKLTDAQRESTNTGLIDLHKGEGEDSYTAEVNLSSEKLLDAVDGLNFLSSQNTYAEAIAGAMGSGSSVSGSFAVAVSKNTVGATLGKNVTVNASKGDVTVNAGNGNNARIIAGSLSAAPGKNATGATVAVMVNNDKVNAVSGDNLTVSAGGNVEHTATATGDQQVFTGAMAVSSGGGMDEDSGAADMGTVLGGAVNVIVSKIEANNRLGKSASLTAGKDAKLSAKAKLDLMAISGSAGIGLGMSTAAGGTINVIVDRTAAETSVDTGAKITAGQSASVASDVSDQLISGTASLSAAPGGMGKSVAGVVNVIVSKSTALTRLKDGVVVKANGGDLDVTANNDAWLLNASLTGSLGSDSGIGGAFNVNVLNRSAKVDVGANSQLTTSGNLRAQSSGRNTDIIAALAAAGATGGTSSAFSGNVGAVVENNDIATAFGSGVKATAAKNALVEAYYSDYTVDAAGNIAATSGDAAVGATVLTMVKNNKVTTDLGKSIVGGYGDGAAIKAASGDSVQGVYVGANAKENQFVGAAGIAGSKGLNLTGEIVTLVNNNKVIADASKATLTDNIDNKYETVYTLEMVKVSIFTSYRYVPVEASYEEIKKMFASGTGLYRENSDGSKVRITNLNDIQKIGKGSISVKADDDTHQIVLAGGLAASKGTGVGAAVTTLVSGKTVEAKAHDMTATNDIAVSANNKDDITQLTISAGVSGSAAVEIGAAIQVLGSKVNAEVGSDVKTTKGGFSLTAGNTADLTNVAAAVGVAKSVSITPVFAYTGFSGETNARLKDGNVYAIKGVTVSADSAKTINQYTVGVAGSRNGALSGAVSVVKVGDTTNALVAAPVAVTAKNMNVTADSDYTLYAGSGVVGAAENVGGAVNGLISIVKGNTLAEMAGKATILKVDGLSVTASSRRDVINAELTVGGAGSVGGAAGVMVLIAGDKMDQEAADQLVYGSTGDKNSKAFDVSGVIKSLNNRGVDTNAMSGLSGDLEGNGKTTDTTQLGSTKDGQRTFDASSGYSDGTDGEDSTYSESDDVSRAKKVGTTAYSSDPQDSVIARIAETAEITGGVKVQAKQITLADLYGAAVGAGGTLGGGVSIAVAKLRSNVLASSTGKIDANGGSVLVEAVSGTEDAKADSSEAERSSVLKNNLGGKLDPTQRSIRAVGLAVGVGGTAGAGFSGGFVYMDNITSVTLAGNVDKASGIDVKAGSQYGNVLAATVAVAGGKFAGLAGSVALTETNGSVSAVLGRNANQNAAVANDGVFNTTRDAKVNVTTDAIMGANAIAAAAGAGMAGAAVGVALATNNLTQNTTVERGVTLKSASGKATLNVGATSVTTADSYLANAAAGFAGVGVGVSLVHVKPTVHTSLGDIASAKNAPNTTTLNGYGTVNVTNDVTSTAHSSLLSIAGGLVGVGVNVMNVYNDTDAYVKASNLTGELDALNISGKLGATGKSSALAASGGIVGVGVNVNYVDVNSKNAAWLNQSAGDLSVKKLSVTTGDAEYTHKTSAETLSAAAGLAGIQIGVNTSVARNRAQNVAQIGGSTLKAGDVTLASYSHGTTDAQLTGVSTAVANIATSVVNALNETTSVASMQEVGKVEGSLTARSDVQGTTNAKLTTGVGSVIGVATNVVTANGRTNALLDATIDKGGDSKAKIDAVVTGKDTVKATVTNLIGLNLGLSVVTQIGGAHSQDVYDNKVTLKNGDYKLSDINVKTTYATTTKADVTPSEGGVSLSTIDVSVNKANATSDAYAGAKLALENAKVALDSDARVVTTGGSQVAAWVRPAKFEWSLAVGVGANKANAENRTTQAAVLGIKNSSLDTAGNVTVQSGITSAYAYASVGGNGKKNSNKRVKISAITNEFNSAYAAQNAASTAAILGEDGDTPKASIAGIDLSKLKKSIAAAVEKVSEAAVELATAASEAAAAYNAPVVYPKIDNRISAANLTVSTRNLTAGQATAHTDGAYTVGLTTAGSLKGEATSGSVHHAVLENVKVKTTGVVDVSATANADATMVGGMPGSLSLAGGLYSEIGAGVGTEKNPQTAKVLIGAGVELDAGGQLLLDALNMGSADASFSKGTSVSLVGASDSKQPTDSWYDTGIVIGDGAKLTTGYKDLTTSNSGILADDLLFAALRIRSRTQTDGSNKVDLSSVGVLANADHMKAEVNVHSDNAITVGREARLTATNGAIALHIDDKASQDIRTMMTGGGLYAGDTGSAEAHITRTGIITLNRDVVISAPNSKVTLLSRSGKGDDLQLRTDVYSGGLITASRSNTDIWLNSNNEIHLLKGVSILAGKDLTVKAVATSYGGAEKGGSGIYVYPRATSHGAYSDPSCWATITLNTTAYVNIQGAKDSRVKLTSVNGDVNVLATNEDMRVYSDPGAHGKGGVGGAAARTYYYLNMQDLIWIDAADFAAKNNINIYANEGLKADKSPDKKDHRPKIIADTVSHMYAGGGTVRATNVLQGKITIGIRTNDKNNVTFKAEKVVHEATHELNYDIEYTRHRAFITTAKRGDNYWETGILTRCDFCGTYSKNKYYDGEDKIQTVGAKDATKALNSAMAKALAPLTDIQRQVDRVNNMTRARYGEEDYAEAAKLFVLDYPAILEKDATLDNEQISRYRLWTNASTSLDVYLLPNATRLYGTQRNGKTMLQYVAEVLRGDVRGDGEIHDIDIITALTKRAFANPVMPVGSTGSLNFLTGELTLPSLADFELYLHEVSANWLLGKIDEGFIRGMIADPDAANDAAVNGTELPEGAIVEGLIPGGEQDNWKLYWLGDTPETAADPDQTLIYLLADSETDEVDAFRTSVNMINNNEEPVDVSLYLYRDSKSDLEEEEKYNCMFFDTPEGEKSLVKIVSNALMGRELAMPLPLRVVLRGFTLEGADLPVYSLTDHYFAMCDGTDGKVSMFDGFYTNTFDGDTFDSDYIRIEGIVDGDLNVTIKEGQAIWPEWTGENEAEDIAGNKYVRVEGEWHPEEDAPAEPLPEDAAAA